MTDLHILLDPVSDFLKCPKKGFNKMIFWHFFTTFFYTIGRHKHSPIYGLYFIYIDFYPLYKKVVLGVNNYVVVFGH